MAIEFIDKNGLGSVEAAEKIKIVSQERKARINAFAKLRALPVQSESFETGGGLYRFEKLQGMAAATRRTAAPTNSTITFGNNITLSPVELVVSQPLESPNGEGIPTSRSDVSQLDGVDFTPIASTKTMNVLMDGEIVTDQAAIFEATGTRAVSADGTYLGFKNAIHGAVSDYFDVSAENTNWTDATAYENFDAGRYSFERGELVVYVNPKDSANMALALEEAGITTGDLAYKDSKEGDIRIINGVELHETRYVPAGKALVAPLGILGAPDPEVMYTMIKTSETEKGDLVTYGKHYYDSVLIYPELTTIVSLTAPVKLASEKRAEVKEAKVAEKEAVKAENEALKAELEALKAEKKKVEAAEKVAKKAEKEAKEAAKAEAAKAEAEAKLEAAREAQRKATEATNLLG